MNRYLLSATLVTVTATAVVLSTTGVQSQPAAAVTPVKTSSVDVKSKRWTGQDIFRATAFGEGELAKSLGTLAPSEDHSPELQDMAKALTSKMQALDSTFFPRFAKNAQSGDPYLVEAGFDEAGELVQQAANELGYTETKMGESSPRWAAITLVLFAAVGAVYAYAAVLQIQAVATSTKLWSKSGKDGDLARERWIADVSVALGR